VYALVLDSCARRLSGSARSGFSGERSTSGSLRTGLLLSKYVQSGPFVLCGASETIQDDLFFAMRQSHGW
jgi:hypothetical protein